MRATTMWQADPMHGDVASCGVGDVASWGVNMWHWLANQGLPRGNPGGAHGPGEDEENVEE